MDHATFILASYCIAGIVIAALIAWITLDYRSLTRTLAHYEKQGVKRGSGRKKKP